MANQNTFLCECGRIIGRMSRNASFLAWNQEEGEPVHRGVSCGGCFQNYIWRRPRSGEYVDVKKCCKDFDCECGKK